MYHLDHSRKLRINRVMNCKRVFVSGRVQGVFFRDSTRRMARQLGIVGHAINLPDGRVEVLACGPVKSVEQLIDWLNQGPELARVDGLQIQEVPSPQGLSGFQIG